MSRCIRKVENEEFYIVYCNTTDVVFPYMFTDTESAIVFVEEFNNQTELSEQFNSLDNPINMEVIKEYKEQCGDE